MWQPAFLSFLIPADDESVLLGKYGSVLEDMEEVEAHGILDVGFNPAEAGSHEFGNPDECRFASRVFEHCVTI